MERVRKKKWKLYRDDQVTYIKIVVSLEGSWSYPSKSVSFSKN